MSSVAVRAALETALVALGQADQIAWENKAFTPTADTPYQRVTLLLAEPDDGEIGGKPVEVGFMQIDLCFPVGKGPGAAQAKAETLRAAFYRGRSLTASGQSVLIIRTPEIVPGYVDGDRYVVPVRIRFRS